jgi:tetratricopeptide (TPR) repeat protein
MKLYFAAAAAALLVSAPAYAVSVMTAGQSVAQDCSIAAGKSAAPMSDRELKKGFTACDVALKGDLSQAGRAGMLVNRGLLQVAAGNDAAALVDFNAGLDRDPGLAAGYMNRGTALLRAERYSEARADFDRAISLGTSDAHVAYFNRGEAQEALGNPLAAYRDYRRAQELAPDFQPAKLELTRFQVTDRRVADNR